MSIVQKRFTSIVLAAVLAVCVACALGLVNSQPAHARISNSKAHSLYTKYLYAQKDSGMSFGDYKFVDLTGDGVDELISGWWPSVCTIKNGKVKKVISADMGSCTFARIYKKKHVVKMTVPDHMGSASYVYYKWSKLKKTFVVKASTYSPCSDAKRMGASARHIVKGKLVSKAKFKTYKRKLIGSSKGTSVRYSHL